MGRKSKLSGLQWEEIGRRMGAGETARSLAREFGVGESSIREHFTRDDKPEIQKVAKQLMEAEVAVRLLPAPSQVAARTLAARLVSISESVAAAAEQAAKTSYRLHSLANAEVQKIDDANPLQNVETLKGINVLTRMGNDAAHIPINLLAANKETMRRIDEQEPEEDELTPERLTDGARRIAFILQRTALQE